MTLLFTDIEDGVRLWEADRDAMAPASARYNSIVREQVEASGGHVFKTVGKGGGMQRRMMGALGGMRGGR